MKMNLLQKFKGVIALIKLVNSYKRKLMIIGREALHWYALSPIVNGELWYPKSEFLEFLESNQFSYIHNRKSSKSYGGQIHRLWTKAEILECTGDFHLAQKIKTEVLQESWERHNLKVGEYVPPFIDSYWLKAFGHQGCLGYFAMAQKLNIIHQSRRTIIDVNQANICRPIMDPILENFEHYRSINGDSIFNHPNLFFLTEKITMLATTKGFLSLPEMIELTLKAAGEIDASKILYTLSAENQNMARNLLVKLGLPKEAWFVGLHVRDGWRMNERNADIESYFSSISHITRLGGWVIRIGDSSMRSIKHLANVIEIFDNSENFLILQDYVLSNSKFFISTTSGPNIFPPLFGVPMLSTNMVAVSKNNFSYLAPSLAIPKVWVERVSNRDVSLEDTFELDLGFVEYSESKNGDFFTRNNTSDEILAATIEMFNAIEGTPSEPSVRQKSLRVLRRESGAVTFGDFAESFLN